VSDFSRYSFSPFLLLWVVCPIFDVLLLFSSFSLVIYSIWSCVGI